MSGKFWALALLLAAPAVAGAHALFEAAVMKPDFSQVRTKEAAKKLVAKGELVAIHLFPTEFGGPDDPMNIVYVTPVTAELREWTIDSLRRQIDEGLFDQLEVVPDYKGTSIVPSSITMKAWHTSKRGTFTQRIEIW